MRVALVLLALGVTACSSSGRDDAAPTSEPAPTTTPATVVPERDADGDVDGDVVPPPPDAGFDYQIGADYPVPDGVGIVSRDWFEGSPADDAYNICYVNAFQTQPDDPDNDRPDETSNWPEALVVTDLDEDPNWTGEYLIDISSAAKRTAAAAWVAPMIETCAAKGFDGIEFDNLDSWIRFEDIPSVQALVPFGEEAAVDFATQLTALTHRVGLASGQKNTAQLIDAGEHVAIGFDFAIVEECGEFDECGSYTAGYGDRVVVIEYTDDGFARACAEFGDELSIVRRDLDVLTPADDGYVFDVC